MAKANRRLRTPSSHARLFSRVAVWDAAWAALSPLAAFYLRGGAVPGAADAPDSSLQSIALYCGVAFFVSLAVFQWFRTSSPLFRFYSIRDALELIKACVVIAAVSAVLTFLLTRLQDEPRSIPILHFMLLASGLLTGRVLLRLRATRRETRTAGMATKNVEHVLIVGASRLAWFFTKIIEDLVPGDYQIAAILDSRPQLKHRSLNGYPIIGIPTDLEKVIADFAAHGVRIDTVVVAAQPDELPAEDWQEISRVCNNLKIELEILPERLFSARSVHTGAVDAPPPAEANMLEGALPASLRSPFWKLKRALDVAITIVSTLVLLPVILVVCLLVMIDVGVPVVFWQQRLGRNGSALHLYKFRTLHTLFDRRTKERREAQSPSAVGRCLRATRLDELPQLWNVLSGDMSIIGPRPLLPVDQPEDTTLRLAVRPGLTGWAQVCGGRLISIEEKNALDEWYIRHASFRLDAYIVFRTIRMLLAGERRDETAIQAALRDNALNATAGEATPAEVKVEDAAGLSSVPETAMAPAWAEPQPGPYTGTEAISS